MIKKLALVISFLSHPLLMPTYLFGSILWIYPDFFRPLSIEQVLDILLRLSVVTLLLPSISIIVLRFTGMVESVYLHSKKERTLPYVFTGVYYAVLVYIFYTGMAFKPFLVLMSSTTLLILTLGIINLKIKISTHAAALCGLLGTLVAIKTVDPAMEMLYPFSLLIFVTGIVMTSRLYLNAHRPIEIYLGGLIGFVICFSGIYIFM